MAARRTHLRAFPLVLAAVAVGAAGCSEPPALPGFLPPDADFRAMAMDLASHFVAAAVSDADGDGVGNEEEGDRLLFERAFAPEQGLRSVAEVYVARETGFVFVGVKGLTPSGLAVSAALHDLDRHGLAPELFQRERLDALLQRLDESGRTLTEASLGAAGDAAVVDEIETYLRGLSAPSGAGIPEDVLRDRVREAAALGELPVLAGRLAQLRRLVREQAPLRVDLEMLLATDLYTYLEEMGALLTLQEDEEIEWAGTKSLTRIQRYVAFHSRLATAGAAALSALEPRHPQYERLRRAYLRYRGYEATGGFPPVPEVGRKVKVEKGKRHPVVAAVRTRLAAEGFLGPAEALPPPEGDDVLDASLSDAVKAFQETRNLLADGVIGAQTIKLLQEQVTALVNRLRLGMRRWRESGARTADRHLVRVNIPEYHAEVWDGTERKMRFRVVVGNAEQKPVPKEKWKPGKPKLERPNATKRFNATIRYVVFNPEWRVPDRIKEEELDPNLAKNPNWYQENGYEYIIDSDGKEKVKQLPGPDNALGMVKILFPNDNDIYMHDTPSKSLFQQPRRAFSHGCIRVENPMDFATYLLDRSGQHDPKLMDEFKKKKMVVKQKLFRDRATGKLVPREVREEVLEEKWIELKEPVPIFIEYNTTTVGDDGRVFFLPDIYELDRPILAGLERRIAAARKTHEEGKKGAAVASGGSGGGAEDLAAGVEGAPIAVPAPATATSGHARRGAIGEDGEMRRLPVDPGP